MSPKNAAAKPAATKPAAEAPPPAAEAPPPAAEASDASAAKRARKTPSPPDFTEIVAADPAEAHVLSVKPWIEESLRMHFGSTAGFEQFREMVPHEVQPLDIVAPVADSTMTSYKEPWRADRCSTALRTTGMYEAGGNLFWLDWRRPSGTGSAIAGSPPRWSHLKEIADKWFTRENLVGGSGGTRMRIVFPVPLIVHAESLDKVKGTAFPGSLELLTGHIWVWGWACGLAAAQLTADMTLVTALWEAALTVTLHLRVGMSLAEKAAATIADSELNKARDRLSSDSFLAFARKCWVIFGAAAGGMDASATTAAGSKSGLLKTHGVKYCGTPVGKTMLTAILQLKERFSEQGLYILEDIEYKHGREVLTAAYTKLGRLGTLVAGTGLDLTPQQVGEYFLRWLRFALDYEMVSPKDVTNEWMDKQRDGTPGALGTAIGRQQVVALVGTWVDDLRDSPQGHALHTELSKIMPLFANYSTYEAAFPISRPVPQEDSLATSQGAVEGGGTGAAAADEAPEEDAVEVVKRRFHNMASHATINFLYDVMAGTHDGAIKEAVRGSSLNGARWMESEKLAPLRDLFRSLTAHRAMVQLSGAGPPPPETRTLQRYKSDAGDEADEAELKKERAETWKQVAALRKKYVTISCVRAATIVAYQQAYEKSAVFKLENLKAGEAHRLFLFSADLFVEPSKSPWSSPPAWGEGAAAAVQFVAQQRGPADVLCFFDGRSRSCRRAMEKLTETCRHQTEIFLIYSPTHRLGRRVAWSGYNCEVCLASFPICKTMLAARERGGTFNAAGEVSTHDTTYSGVQPVPWAALPLLSVADKAKLLAVPQESVEQPKQGVFDPAGGIPLFWQERKPTSFWKKLYGDLQARCVVDLTPGGGLAARAALDVGLPYLGFTRTAEHGQWLGQVCDRNALQAAVTSGTALHNADLAGSIEDHFGDVLAHIRDADAAVDKEGDGDGDDF